MCVCFYYPLIVEKDLLIGIGLASIIKSFSEEGNSFTVRINIIIVLATSYL